MQYDFPIIFPKSITNFIGAEVFESIFHKVLQMDLGMGIISFAIESGRLL
jgi:hypothetical protein